MVIDAQMLGYSRPGRCKVLPGLFGKDQTSGTAALTEVSCSLAEGELLALLGHNGAGKSTLIKLLLGLIAPSRGSLKVLGHTPSRGMAGVGYLPEHCRLYPRLSGSELFALFGRLKGATAGEVNELIEAFSLASLLHRPCQSLSKGQLQRLSLALALLGKPRLLLLDEPTTGLDPGAAEFMYQRLDRLKQNGCALVICSHDLALLEPRADKLLFIGSGRQQAFGRAADILGGDSLRAAYSRLMPNAFGESSDPELISRS
ncbi:ABC transporter ATP-binding protein [Shewanella sp. JM162201]|uniref:ABC transporter ATP-binding protein n=1 Tax=Shewanella jiangmenensis TaxID=2837387 RepID=A0ABS5V2M3_9GAMM|nr:ABC transporter ATP-binding protein [Shewanella jiangmenensis]MBT1444071.1 ABC transporter ATP-binding protein [Shewanella jiangmenensis]